MELTSKINGKAPLLSVKDVAMFSGLQQDFDIDKSRNELGFDPKPSAMVVEGAMQYLVSHQLVKLS